MPRILVADAEVAHTREIARSVEANLARLPPTLRASMRARVTQRVRQAVGPRRPVGTVHAVVAAFDCPEGHPNCRNCGDPAHADACRAAGHCLNCGTRHGVAPDAILVANGYRIVEDPPA